MFKKNKDKPATFNKHGIRIEGAYGVRVFKDRLKRRKMLGNAMMGDSAVGLDDDIAQVKGFASVLNQLKGDMVIEHPEFGVRLLINPQIGAKAAYFMSCHGYEPAYLDCIKKYVKNNATVLDVGAGFGVASVVAASRECVNVIAIEPNPALHPIIAGNASLNKQSTLIEQGCVVPSVEQGEVDFYISEDVWSSSIYVDNVEMSVKSLKVPVLSLSGLIKKHEADTLLLDVKGAELGLFDTANIQNIQTIIISFDYDLLGGQGVSKVITVLFSKGFSLLDMKYKVAVFCRDAKSI